MFFTHLWRCGLKLFFALLLSQLILVNWVQANESVLTINSGSSAPMILNDNEGFYPKLIHALFERMNIKVQTVHMPASSSLKSVKEGIHDGMIARIAGLEKKQKNLIPVREKVIDLNFTAYSTDKNIKIEKWSDLQAYNVAYIRGWKIYDKKVTAYKSLVKVKKPDQLFKLLQNNRADVVLYQNLPARYLMNQMKFYPDEHKPYLATKEMFIYMHKRHAEIVPKIEKTLKEMKSDGSYKKLFDEYITSVITSFN